MEVIMFKRLAWSLVAGLMLCETYAQGDNSSVSREITAWWKDGLPKNRALKRLVEIESANTGNDIKRETLLVGPIENKDSDSKIEIIDIFPTADVFHFTTNP